jgi:hypothetical protein
MPSLFGVDEEKRAKQVCFFNTECVLVHLRWHTLGFSALLVEMVLRSNILRRRQVATKKVFGRRLQEIPVVRTPRVLSQQSPMRPSPLFSRLLRSLIVLTLLFSFSAALYEDEAGKHDWYVM